MVQASRLFNVVGSSEKLLLDGEQLNLDEPHPGSNHFLLMLSKNRKILNMYVYPTFTSSEDRRCENSQIYLSTSLLNSSSQASSDNKLQRNNCFKKN